MARKFFVGGNFKMNGTSESIKKIIKNLNDSKLDSNVEVVIAPPALYLQLAKAEVKQPTVQVSAQNVYDKPDGAFTGEISVSQLADSDIHWTILGHSERRTLLGETDEIVASKTKFAIDGGLSVVWCCGESLAEREAGNTVAVVERQLAALAAKISGADWQKVVIAYEPIWAIGTGKVATVQQAQEAHEAIRNWLKAKVSDDVAEQTRILYGGSVKGDNSKDLAKEKDIDGFLVGGASLKPEFVDIINSNL
ncbi:Triosephosphate isomerase [Chaetomium sp. MPI-SDFR-AT-0129]|uniref:Triosephosphate isomerase n=1 Tax=Dichotomopilus funicola TaxID=1934379 RepID=A0AAN6ZPQ0_9PEZI|nr:Triosephosphate isomerase [Chaetomium sp. MPI-SDFR-AT-0129]KAK4146317.1 Triosephosphate isomerase [Dichotomopilus funicola]